MTTKYRLFLLAVCACSLATFYGIYKVHNGVKRKTEITQIGPKFQPTIGPEQSSVLQPETWTGPLTSSEDCPNFSATDVSTKPSACVIPEIDPFHPSIMKYIKEAADPNCPGVTYGTLINGTLTLADSVKSISYRAIKRSGDFKFILGPIVALNSSNKIPDELIEVEYKLKNDHKTVKDYLYQVIPKKDLLERKAIKQPGLPYSILVIGIDSLSFGNTPRTLRKLYAYLKNDLGALIYKGHAVVGDGTTPQLTAMLTGKHVQEQYEARMGYRNAKQLDGWTWIFENLKKHGYLTGMSEDGVHEGPFQYRLTGFNAPPTDFYPRPFFLGAAKLARSGKDRCINNKNIGELHLNYVKLVFDTYPNNLKFFLSFNAAFSHHDINGAKKNERAILDVLKHLRTQGHLNTTILIVMGDHGLRFGPVRSLVQGKLEERLPLYTMVFPRSFRDKYPHLMKILKTNTERLTSWFDVHATFQHFLSFPNLPEKLVRGVSLLTEVPADRTCEHAGVSNHWCPCLEWITVPVNHSHVQKAALTAVQYMNRLLQGDPGSARMCQNLSLKAVNFAQLERPNAEVAKKHGGIQRFKQSTQYFCRYQLQFVTSPNQGVYEATVKLNDKRFILSASISRINQYGDQPACVADRMPFIRKFCLCKDYKGVL